MKTRYKMLFDIHIKSNIFSSTVVMIRHERISSLSHLKNLSRYLCALDWIAHHLSSKKRYSRTRYARFEPRFSSNPNHKKSDLSRYLCALDWTRTSTAVATTPSRLRVYQFHHQGIE